MWKQIREENGTVRYFERYKGADGKNHVVSVTYTKHTARNEKLAAQELRIIINERVRTAQPDTLMLSELVDLYDRELKKTVKPSTHARNIGSAQTMLRILGDSRVSEITAGTVRAALINTGKGPGYYNEQLSRFKAMMRWAYRADLISDISWLYKLEKLKDDTKHIRAEGKFLEADELKTLLGAMKVPRWRDVTEFLVLTGMRYGEAAALHRDDIDLGEKLIHVRRNYSERFDEEWTPKTPESIRDVYIQHQLLPVCERILADSDPAQDLFFCPRLSYWAYNKYLHENATKAIGRPITPHTLRHTCCSLLAEQGVSFDQIARRLGHGQNSKVTKAVYFHVTEKLKAKDNAVLENMEIY